MRTATVQQQEPAAVVHHPLVHRDPSIRQLAADPSAPRAARRHAIDTLQAWGLSAVADTAALVVSELVTNAVRATAELARDASMGEPAAVALRLTCVGGSLIVEVWDRSPVPPRRRAQADDDENGRGLMIVESLSTRWAYYRPPAAPGKVTWSQIELPDTLDEALLESTEPGRPLPRRKPAGAPVLPFSFSDDLDVLQRVADGLRALDWDLPDR